MTWRALGVVALIGHVLAMGGRTAPPAPAVMAGPTGIPWKDPRFSYTAQDEPLAQTLSRVCSSLGIQTIISDKVTGQVSGRFDDVTPDTFLATMANAYGLIWFYDGSVLYISKESEIESKIIRAPGLDYDQLARILHNLGIDTRRPYLSLRITEGIVSVSGPPRYVQLLNDIINGLLAMDMAVPDAVGVFPLKHAWAYDTTITSSDSTITVPGVATILQKLLPSYASGAYGVSSAAQGVPPTIAKLTNTSPPNPYATTASGGAATATGATRSASTPGVTAVPAETAGASQWDPLITYDTRLNAVIVRDTKERLRSYKQVIEDLDKPVMAVQIEAAIIDINVDYTLEYGNQFLFTGTAGSFGTQISLLDPGDTSEDVLDAASADSDVGSSSTSSLTSLLDSAGEIIQAGGLNFSSIITTSAIQFLDRIQVLEQDGWANILSQPSVITLDNLEAIIQRTETFYVQVPGTYTTDLYNVSEGIILSVTPHIIEENGKNLIKVVVAIQDGEIENSTGETVDDLPLTTTDSLNTQAILHENESLLIGGIIREEKSVSESGIPGLKDVPVLGFFFKQRQKETVRLKRLFLITPRLITRSYRPTENVTPLFDTLQEQAAKRGEVEASTMRPPNPQTVSLRTESLDLAPKAIDAAPKAVSSP